jgi:hypothetical protein
LKNEKFENGQEILEKGQKGFEKFIFCAFFIFVNVLLHFYSKNTLP